MVEGASGERWVRMAGVYVWVVCGCLAVVSLGYLWYCAAHGEVVRAVLGAAGALGSVGLGLGLNAVVQVAAVVGRNDRRIEEMQRKMDGLIQLVEQATRGAAAQPDEATGGRVETAEAAAPGAAADDAGRAGFELGESGRGGVSRLVAGDVRRSFPRLAEGAAREAEEPVEGQSGDTSGGDGGAADEVADALITIRERFRRKVFVHDFAGALGDGEVLLERYPDSAEARQFLQIQEVLARLGQGSSDVMAS